MQAAGKRAVLCIAALLFLLLPAWGVLHTGVAASAVQMGGAPIVNPGAETVFDANRFGTLQINGVDAPFDAETCTFYVPQSMETAAWDGTLTWSNTKTKAALCDDAFLSDKQAAIAEGRRFELLLTRGRQFCRIGCVFTGLPMATIKTRSSNYNLTSVNMSLIEGTLCVFDPAAGGDSYTVTKTDVVYHMRGTSSSDRPKLSYRLALYTAAGKTNHVSLLGLRKDDDWILAAMYDDTQKNRDMTANYIWNLLCEKAADSSHIPCTHGAYAELLIDSAYQGVYCLMEPVGTKSTGINKETDYIFRFYVNSIPILKEHFLKPSPTVEDLSACCQFKWPNDDVPDEAVRSMVDYSKALMIGQRDEASDALYDRIDLDALIDLDLFLNGTAGRDAPVKNAYIVGRQCADGSYRWTLLPWDMDRSFGLSYSSSDTADTGATDEIYHRTEMRVLLQHRQDTILPKMKARWKALRTTVFSEDIILAYLAKQTEYLVASGAFARDTARWPGAGNCADLSPMLQFMKARLLFLDTYYDALA